MHPKGADGMANSVDSVCPDMSVKVIRIITVISDNRFYIGGSLCLFPFEPPHDKTNKVACAPSEDSDQSGHDLI